MRQGRVQSANDNTSHREPPRRVPPRRDTPHHEPTHRAQPLRRRPQPMNHKNSSESSISVESFVHMVASGSTETLTTPASSKRESIPSARNPGARKPGDAMPAQYRTAQPHIFSYQPPPRGSAKGPALYTPPATFASMPPAPPPPPPQPQLRPQPANMPQPSRPPPVAANRQNVHPAPTAPKTNPHPPM